MRGACGVAMKIGFLSDAHGNPEGAERCLAVLRRAGADQIYFLGDAVGYLSGWGEVLRLLHDGEVQCLMGNHDQQVLIEGADNNEASAYRLRGAYLDGIADLLPWMASWPTRREIRCDDYRLLLVHGSPANPLTGYVYPWSDLSSLARVDADIVAMGHTHRPFVAEVGGRTLINVGSCGLPRDVGNLASCASFDGQTGVCEILRVPFDVTRLLSRVDPPHTEVLRCLERRADEYCGMLVAESD